MLRHFDFQHERMLPAPSNKTIPRRATARGRYGEIAYASHDDPIDRAIRLYGEWAQIEIDFLCGLIGRGSTVLDVGARIGTHAIAFSKRVGATGTVHAFEPQAVAHELLKSNLASSGSLNVTAEPLAVVDRAGGWVNPEVEHGSQADVVSVALRSVGSSTADPGDTTRAIAIDDLSLERCDLVRIDVGGTEALVIKGMAGVISRLQPLICCGCSTLEAGIDLLRLLPRSYRAFFVRCPAFNEANLLGASDNIFGHACETSLLFVPPGGAQSVGTGRVRGAEVIAIDSFEELGRAILATPRYGDASAFERDPERLIRELSSLGAALSERNAELLGATQAHMHAAQRIDELRESLQVLEQAKLTLQDRADALLEDRDGKDGEIVRLRFRVESLTACLRRLEDRLDRANTDREQATQEAVRLRRELDAARHGMDADIKDIAGHCSRLADALAQDGEQTARLAAACDGIATRSACADAGLEDVVRLFREALDGRQRTGPEPQRPRRRSRIGALGSMFHPLRRDYEQVAGSGLFDEQWYLASNRDVAERGVDPLAHYLREGASENRDPSPHFSTGRYLASNPDVARARLNPLVHYIRHGRREGRPMMPCAAARDVAP